MKERPSPSRSTAPSPRKASDSKGRGIDAWWSAVGMELHELEIGARNRRLQRECDAVAGRQGRVGGDRKALARAAGREHDVRRAYELEVAVGPQREHAGAPAAAPRAARSRTNPRAPRCRRVRTASTSARSISAPVASPPACTTRASEWPPSRARAGARASSVSKCAPSAASSRTRSGPSVTSMRTASTSHSPAPAVSVSARCSSGVSGCGERGRDAALRVARRGVRELAFRQHEHRQASTRRVERGRQPRDATPQHEDVEHGTQPRWREGWSRIQTRFEPARSTASSLADRPVRLVDVHDDRRVAGELGFAVRPVRDHDHAVARARRGGPRPRSR